MKNDLKIHLIAAARPNFMKVAPLYHALKKEPWARPIIVHSGQHYDINMSDVFFKDLMMPEPDIHLEIGSGTHAEQTGGVMIAYEKVLLRERPDLVVVVGDVNSTIAATLAAVKLGIKVAHLEAGLRSFDKTMPEEINRIATDALSDILWTPSMDANENLEKEGVASDKVICVGNIMIDSLEMRRPKIESLNARLTYGLEKRNYGLVTLHRPANVDDKETLTLLCDELNAISSQLKLLFPVHPRTKNKLNEFGLYDGLEQNPNIILTEPINYVQFMSLVFDCALVLTDSGGIQEETTYLGIPCFTVRPNTERPVTIIQGTNQLCKCDEIRQRVVDSLQSKQNYECNIEMWDGNTARRVVKSIADQFNG